MFEFTTQSVYNNIVIATDAQVKSKAVTGYNVIKGTDPKKPEIRVGNTRFNKDTIESISIKNPTSEVFAKVTFDMSKVAIAQNSDDESTTGRIALYLGLSMNSQDSFYANDLVYKGKPLYIEFAINKGDSAATLAARVKKVADKFLLFQAEEKILDIIVDGANVTIQGTNGYQIIKKAVLQKFVEGLKTVDCCTYQGDFQDVIVGIPTIYTTSTTPTPATVTTVTGTGKYLSEEGKEVSYDETKNVPIFPGLEAFGDYWWIIHNLRLPTLANTHFFSPTQQEMPAVGQVYTQFTIKMNVDNVGIAGEAVGQRHTSNTTHVFYVAGNSADSNSPAGKLKTELTSILLDSADDLIKVADTAFENPYGEEEGGNDGGNG